MLICNSYLTCFIIRNGTPKIVSSGSKMGVNWPIHQLLLLSSRNTKSNEDYRQELQVGEGLSLFFICIVP